MMTRGVATASRPLRPGDTVEIRSKEEILATLDGNGRLDELPFMPEMLRFCGQTATVHKRAERLCDTIDYGPQRRMRNTVFLAGLRCDGSAHGGCQAGCLIFWKEAWLRPITDRADDSMMPPRASGLAADVATANMTVPHLESLTRRAATTLGAGERYVCQATEASAASAPMQWWEPAQYVRDVTSGNASPLAVYIGLIRWLFIRIQKRLVNGSKVPFIKGRLRKTPRRTLDLQPGERVRVRTKEEIAATLDRDNRNHGLSFDAEMLRYCGKEYRVLRRVNRIIDEKTGEMLAMKGDCIVLDDVYCRSEYHRLCGRSIYAYWREIWLTRVAEPSADWAPVRPDHHEIERDVATVGR